MLLRDYLAQSAYFLSPEPNSNQRSSSDITDVELKILKPEWNPKAARHDPQLVTSLINVLEDSIQDVEVPMDLVNYFENGRKDQLFWKKNEKESDARDMVYMGALKSVARFFNAVYDTSLSVMGEEKAVGFKSRVDYVICKEDEPEEPKAVVELKSPNVFRLTETELFNTGNSFRLVLRPGAKDVSRKVINKLSLYMAAHQTEWGALTCHDKWVFVRLHKGTAMQKPFLTYSTVERQAENTRPFRALLGMILAAVQGINVESNANMEMALTEIPEDPEDSSFDNDGQSGQSQLDSSYDPEDDSPPTERGMRSEPPLLRQPRQHSQSKPDILLRWSPNVTTADDWLSVYSVTDPSEFSSLGAEIVRLWLQCEIGEGSTGCVYEANLDAYGQLPHSYAIKAVKKGTSEAEKGCMKRLYDEAKIYRTLEQARANGQRIDIAPRCYGLYETKTTLMLVMDYVGESLPGSEFKDLQYEDRISLFKAVTGLHALGIAHEDLEPRNVTRHSDGTFKIIDFTHSRLHRCPGLSRTKGSKQSNRVCPELRFLSKMRLDYPFA